MADVEPDTVDVQVDAEAIGNGEADVGDVLTMQPRNLGDQVIPVLPGRMVVLLGCPTPVIPWDVHDVHVTEVRGKVAVHQAVQFADRQAVPHHLLVVAAAGGTVDFTTGVVAIAEDVEHREIEAIAQNLLGPLERSVNQALGAAARDGKVVLLQAAALLGCDNSVVMTIAEMEYGVLFDTSFLRVGFPYRRQRLDSDDLLREHVDHRLEQAPIPRPGLGLASFPVAFLGQVGNVRFQFQDARVGWIVVADRLPLAAGPLLRRTAIRPRLILVGALGGDVGDGRAADPMLLRHLGLCRAGLAQVGLDALDLLRSQSRHEGIST